MRGQATAEFLAVFLVTIGFITIIAGALLVAGNKAGEQAEAAERIISVEEAARAIEAHANSGIAMVFDIDGVESGVEQGSVRVDYNGKAITVEGVFDGYEKGGQPV